MFKLAINLIELLLSLSSRLLSQFHSLYFYLNIIFIFISIYQIDLILFIYFSFCFFFPLKNRLLLSTRTKHLAKIIRHLVLFASFKKLSTRYTQLDDIYFLFF